MWRCRGSRRRTPRWSPCRWSWRCVRSAARPVWASTARWCGSWRTSRRGRAMRAMFGHLTGPPYESMVAKPRSSHARIRTLGAPGCAFGARKGSQSGSESLTSRAIFPWCEAVIAVLPIRLMALGPASCVELPGVPGGHPMRSAPSSTSRWRRLRNRPAQASSSVHLGRHRAATGELYLYSSKSRWWLRSPVRSTKISRVSKHHWPPTRWNVSW